MSENKDNKLTLINEKTANDYLTHTADNQELKTYLICYILIQGLKSKEDIQNERI